MPASDATARAGLYDFVPGRKLLATKLAPSRATAHRCRSQSTSTPLRATSHVSPRPAPRRRWRRPPRPASALPIISPRWSAASHVSRLLIRRPRTRRTRNASSPKRCCRRGVASRARLTKDARDARAGDRSHRVLRSEQCCLSPSDFGFHNALADETGQMIFLDFHDMPAVTIRPKLVSDFFCQPEIPDPPELPRRLPDASGGRAGTGRGRPYPLPHPARCLPHQMELYHPERLPAGRRRAPLVRRCRCMGYPLPGTADRKSRSQRSRPRLSPEAGPRTRTRTPRE